MAWRTAYVRGEDGIDGLMVIGRHVGMNGIGVTWWLHSAFRAPCAATASTPQHIAYLITLKVPWCFAVNGRAVGRCRMVRSGRCGRKIKRAPGIRKISPRHMARTARASRSASYQKRACYLNVSFIGTTSATKNGCINNNQLLDKSMAISSGQIMAWRRDGDGGVRQNQQHGNAWRILSGVVNIINARVVVLRAAPE